MCRGRAVGGLYFVAALISTLSGATDDAVKVEVERPQLVLDNSVTPSPYLAFFKLLSDIQFTNQSKASIEIPDLGKLRSGVVGITFDGVEAQQSDGTWRFVVLPPNLVWKIDTVFADCRSLGPGETAEIKGYSHGLSVFKSNLSGLGSKATVRLTIELSCKQRDGNVVLKAVKTSPFVLSIPALP
jgi:hypothetical protein